jgi:general secretion pathway protein K
MRLCPVRQRGAALLLAMLTVALVASVSAAAYWQQWRSLQLEQTARQRAQSIWLLTGALDWARLILREDARASSNVDHLAEPWAVPLQETRLSSFLAGREASADDLALDARLSGHIEDEQGKLNLRNLIETKGEQVEIDAAERATFARLFAALGLPPAELLELQRNLLAAYHPAPKAGGPLRPLRFEQLGALGLGPASLVRLSRHATWLPEPTLLNLNTASALALQASLPGLELAQAQSLVAQRERRHFSAIDDLREVAPQAGRHLNAQHHGVTSRYFRVHGRIKLDEMVLEQVALVVRNGIRVRVVWRQHGGLQRQDAVLK